MKSKRNTYVNELGEELCHAQHMQLHSKFVKLIYLSMAAFLNWTELNLGIIEVKNFNNCTTSMHARFFVAIDKSEETRTRSRDTFSQLS